MTTTAQPTVDRLAAVAAARADANRRYFAAQAPALADLCHAMAERFLRGGRILACGTTPADRSDVRHVAVEFVHPVIVGKRALPALGLEAEEVALLTGPEDIVMRFHDGCLDVALGERRWHLEPRSGDPFIDQELIEQSYHVLWELVHVFFEHRGLLAERPDTPRHDSGASSFLYPFLAQSEDDLPGVLADVRASALAKAEETSALRAATLAGSGAVIASAIGALRTSLDAGGTLLALGNGGSATDAMDVVADLRHPPGGRRPRRALDLTEDPAILTAIANDVGHDAVFARQVIAHARPGDVVLGISTSGGSANVLMALAEARRRSLPTIALVGYDGGRILAEQLADHVIVSPSQNIPRIQEAQATVLHLLVEGVLDPGASGGR
jgi:D-sedoheptulose 7-phosphate isomerase